MEPLKSVDHRTDGLFEVFLCSSCGKEFSVTLSDYRVTRCPACRGVNRKKIAYPKRPTWRQLQIITCIAQQKLDKEIAFELGLSPKTVKVYCSQIYDLLGVRNRVGAALWAMRNGLI